VHPAYQRLARSDEPRSPWREIATGLVVLVAIVLGFLFLPALPGEEASPAVGARPADVASAAEVRGELPAASRQR